MERCHDVLLRKLLPLLGNEMPGKLGAAAAKHGPSAKVHDDILCLCSDTIMLSHIKLDCFHSERLHRVQCVAQVAQAGWLKSRDYTQRFMCCTARAPCLFQTSSYISCWYDYRMPKRGGEGRNRNQIVVR